MASPAPKTDKVALRRTAKGKRPAYFVDPATDKLLSMVLILAQELSVTRERLDSVERLMSASGSLDLEQLESFCPTGDEAAVRDQRRAEMLRRLFGPAEGELSGLAPDRNTAEDADIDEAIE